MCVLPTETEDFIPITTVLRFEAGGPLSLSFNDSITNDNRVEVMVEPFVSQFSIPASSRFADSIMDLTGQATTEIIDDDGVYNHASIHKIVCIILQMCIPGPVG